MSTHYITESVIHGHHVSKDYFTPFISTILSCEKERGNAPTYSNFSYPFTYFSLFISGEVFVRLATVAISTYITTWHMAIIFCF